MRIKEEPIEGLFGNSSDQLAGTEKGGLASLSHGGAVSPVAAGDEFAPQAESNLKPRKTGHQLNPAGLAILRLMFRSGFGEGHGSRQTASAEPCRVVFVGTQIPLK